MIMAAKKRKASVTRPLSRKKKTKKISVKVSAVRPPSAPKPGQS